jgi:vacuolar iron transporter family protein
MEQTHPIGHTQLARKLILDELFDLSLYQALSKLSTGETRSVLQDLIQVEEKHYAFWQDFSHIHMAALDLTRRVKL